MTETLHQSSDVPNFDTYPSNQPERLLPERATGDSALVQRAQQIGSVIGRTVSVFRQARERLHDLSSEAAGAAATCMSELADAAKAKAQEWGQAAATRVSEVGESVADKAGELGERTKSGYYRVRRRARQVSREHPLEVIVAAGAVGILLGIGIRVWRANRAY